MAERAKIVCRLRAYWDVHRFRMAPQVARHMEQGRREGWLHILAGRTERIGCDGGRFAVHWLPRGGGSRISAADAIVNCTGPDSDIGRSELGGVRALVERACIGPDPLRIGIDVDAEGRVLDRDGRSHARLWAAGPLARSMVGEATGVPEASQHARIVAKALASAIARRTGLHALPGDAA